MEEGTTKKNIKADIFLRLVKNIKAPEFKHIIEENFNEDFENIKLLSHDEIVEKWSLSLDKNEDYIVISNLCVSGAIQLDGLRLPILLIDSQFEYFTFGGSTQTRSHFPKRIQFYNSSVKEIAIENCSIDYFILECPTEIDSLSVQKSTIKNLEIWSTKINVFSFCKTIVGVSCQLFKCNIGLVEIKESELNDLTFNNTCVQSNISFSDSKANQIIFIKSVVKGLWLNTTTNIKTLALSEKSKFSLIDFSNQCNVHEFFMTNVKLSKLKINQNCNIDKFKIDRSLITDSFNCEENVNLNQILVDSSFLNEVGFVLTRVIQFEIESSYTGHIILKQVNFDTLKIDMPSKTGDIVFGNSQIDFLFLNEHYGSITIVGTKITLGHIDNSKINRFDISKGSEFEIYLKNCQVNWLSFTHTTLNKDSLLSISESSIYFLEMNEFTVHGDLHIRKVLQQTRCFEWWWYKADDLKEMNFNEYQAVIDDLKKDYLISVQKLRTRYPVPTFKISHSTLGKTEFSNCKIADFRFEFNNSRITDCFISGGTIPSEKIVIIDDQGNELNQGDIETHSQKASIYNQFKKIFESQGDAYSAAQFQAKWAEHQKKYLQLEYAPEKKKASFWKKPWRRVKLICSELSQDIGIFRLNRWSNNHGESWLRALAFTGISTGILYLLFLWSIGRCFNTNGLDLSLVGYYFEFLTPSFKPDFITGERPSSCSIGLYYAGKAVFAYGLYQFISAFRKHGRKK